MKNIQPKYGRLTLAIRFNSLFFPFDIKQFCDAISQQGYFLTEEAAKIPFGARLRGALNLGNKGPIAVTVGDPGHTLTIQAPSPDIALEEINLVEKTLKTDLDFHLEDTVSFYEFVADAIFKSSTSTFGLWQQHLQSVPLVDAMSKHFGMQLGLFSLGLAPLQADPNEIDWCDIRISPAIQPGLDHYWVNVVFRNRARRQVMDFVQKYESLLRAVRSLIEEVIAQ
jgi:hypothetical protein